MSDESIPLYYTFGNHMHWVDMEWLWGYFVLPESVRDMLHFSDATGAKGNVNFDAIGYEKMAVEAPETLAELRAAVQDKQIEVVGASYGQPYGLFHGSESNVRQRVYGARSVMRLLGVRPKTFWEEEFDFFPQLPQILRGVGYEYASLFFQWTWHTPHIPEEDVPVVWWEGMDGSRLLTATRNDLNLHQWPEDFEELLASDTPRKMPAAGIVQWLELMPSPDWMCRSEVLLPEMRALIDNPDFDLQFATLSEYLEAAKEHAVVRRYTLDDVFHGMSLGKNGDLFRRVSRRAEQTALTAESLTSMLGLFGRPYPSWDVYPTWELEEAWRELLSAQHHDNDECEGLCGHVGMRSYERSLGLTGHIVDRSLDLLAKRAGGSVVYNPLGWSRDAVIDGESGAVQVVVDLPPFGYSVVKATESYVPSVELTEDDTIITLQRGDLAVEVDKKQGVISQITNADFPEGALRDDTPLADLEMIRNEEPERFEDVQVEVIGNEQQPTIRVRRRGREGHEILITIAIAPELDAIDVEYTSDKLPRPDGWMHAALKTTLAVDLPDARLIHDHPYGVSEIEAQGTYTRKYPTGHWMTSPQVYEEVENPFTSLHLLDVDAGARANDAGRFSGGAEGVKRRWLGERGLLYLHDGSQAMQRDGDCIYNILSMNDPWDEDYFVSELHARVRLVPHGAMTNTERWRLAQEFTRPALVATSDAQDGDLPAQFGSIWCDAPNVAVSAFYRETEEAGAQLDQYAGNGMDFPYVLRLAELDGEAGTVCLRVPGPVAAVYRTNLLGELIDELTDELTPVDTDAPIEGPAQWQEISLHMDPHQIATLYLDLVPGRKIPRNLDEHRHVWAKAHRVDNQD